LECTTSPSHNDLLPRLKRRLVECGRGDAELTQILELIANIHLAQAMPDPETVILSDHQIARRRGRELPLLEDLNASSDEIEQRVEDAAVVETALSEAGLTPDERVAFVMSVEASQSTIATALAVSERTVRSLKKRAREKLSRLKIPRHCTAS